MACEKENHIIGCSTNYGSVNVHTYCENGRKHPGELFCYCPRCGKMFYIDVVATAYEKLRPEVLETYDYLKDHPSECDY